MNSLEENGPGANSTDNEPVSPGRKCSAEFNYHLLRNAVNDFGKTPSELNAEQLQQVERKALKSHELEALVMSSDEARDVVVADKQLEQAMQQLQSRYADNEEFENDLARNGLDADSLRNALYRELLFDSVMQRVAANSLMVTDIDVMLFYEMHHDRFETPEQRVARHLLITINEDYPENSPEAALERMQQVVKKIGGKAHRFEKFARQFSECPTAMEGGKLGEVQRGQLYPELDSVLFGMQSDEISPIIESELGYHILLCEKIRPAKNIPRNTVKQRIHDLLLQRSQRNCQKHWLSQLKAKAAAGE